MLKQPSNKRSYGFLSSMLTILLWLILAILLFARINISFHSIIFSISTILIFTHVLYAGYFIFSKKEKIDIYIILFFSIIYICLIFFIANVSNVFLWFFWLLMTFLCALPLHSYYKYKTKQTYLKEFCNYKLFIEICGILFSLLGMLLYYFFPNQLNILAVITIVAIVSLNISIFNKKRIYNVYYADSDIPQDPLVSIVIVAYNEELFIGKLLESIKTQQYKNFEVILVDDHSNDKTVQIAKSFEQYFPLRIVQKEVRGISRSRNYGADFAKGDIILFLDSDVILPPNFIGSNIKSFVNQKLSVAGIDFIAITDNKVDKFITSSYRIWLKTVQYFNPRGIGFCIFASKKLHDKILFDESIIMSEDFDYVRRATQEGKFRILADVPAEVSWRRFYKENRLLLILKYIVFEWYRQNIGEIRKKILPYEFGN